MNIKKTIIMLSMAFSASSLTMYAGPADGPIDDEAVKTYAEMVNMSEIGRPSPAPVKAKFDVLNAGSKIASPRIVLDENSKLDGQPGFVQRCFNAFFVPWRKGQRD